MASIRSTKQRQAIQRVFEQSNRPLRPDEVLHLAAAIVPKLGVATIYRNISRLVEDGWLMPVEIPGQPPRYEVAGKHHHHHFLCRNCEQMFEVGGCLDNVGSLTPTNFLLEDHHITLYGLCKDCQ